MQEKNYFKKNIIIFVIFALFLLSVPVKEAVAASYEMKAPETFHSVKLSQEDRYSYSPFSNFAFKLEGWACDEKFAETAIYRIREMNRMVQPLSETREVLKNLEKVLIGMAGEKLIVLSRNNVENVVYKAIADTIKKAGFSSERSLIDGAEYLSKESIEKGKGGIKGIFEYYGDGNIFQNVQYGKPSGIWKISKMEPDDPPSVVFVAQNCYQKQDLDAMVNYIVSAARKLEEALFSYQDTKKRVLALGGSK